MESDKIMELNLKDCTGCSSCANACKKKAIKMIRNSKGFLYPQINQELCVGCGKCKACCPLETKYIKEEYENNVYAMQSTDEELRWNSTSGGAFSEFAKIILQRGGAVVGAEYRDDWTVEHCMIYEEDRLSRIRRSKYQQSDIGTIYIKIREELNAGKEVLFCGTPCQGAGLQAFLKKRYDKLYISDFICRGVCSPLLFQEYLKEMKRIYQSEIDSIWMKNKRLGWHNISTEIKFRNGKEYLCKGRDDSYLRLFLFHNIGVRNSCFNCRFKNDNSVADMTFGDFWGMENSSMDDNLGTSAIIIRSQKGQALFDLILENSKIEKMSIEDVIKGNPCLCNSLDRGTQNEDVFFEILTREGYQKAYESIT